MPVWASALVTVIAGLGAGVFGAWVTAWNDRRERFRDRMIETADDFAAAADALVRFRDAIGAVHASKDAVRMKSATEDAWTHRDIALRRSAHVDLLFGPGSTTAGAANDLLNHLAVAAHSLTPPVGDADAADAALQSAASDLRRFQRSAFGAIRLAAPPSSTLRETLRGRRLRSATRGS
jgi:hypothetical protein